MRRSLLAFGLALVLPVAGCAGGASSSSSFSGAEKEVADQVEKLESAGKSGDAKVICDEVLAKSVADAIAAAGSTCDEEMDKAIKDADDYSLDVEDVAVDGDKATAKVKGKEDGKDVVRTFQFERDGSSWRATNLGT